jgi:hypothetical protein
MLTASWGIVHHGDLDAGHDHRDYSLPLPLRDAASIARPAVGVIEVRCEDAMPWARIKRETRSWVWQHFE